MSNAKNHLPPASFPHAEPLPLDSPARKRLPPLLRRAWYSLNQAFRRRIAHTRVTPDQFTVLRILTEAGPRGIAQKEITALMSSDPNTIAALLERMEAARLIERRPHEKDRRAHRIRLLAAGKRKYAVIRQVAIDLQREVLAVLPEHQREQFLDHLGAVGNACRLAAERSPKQRGPTH